MRSIQITAIGFLAILALLLLFSINANPDNNLLYGLKRAQEKMFLSLQVGPQQRLNYLDSLLVKRYRELEYLTNHQKTYLLWNSSLRFGATAGEMTNLILENNLKDRSNEFIAKFQKHHQAINNLLVNYPGDLDPTEENSKFLSDAKNYLSLYISQLSQVK